MITKSPQKEGIRQKLQARAARTEIDLPEGAAPDLAAEPELVPNPRLHPAATPKKISHQSSEASTKHSPEEKRLKNALSLPQKTSGGS